MSYPPWFKEPPSWSIRDGNERNRTIQLHREILQLDARVSPTPAGNEKRKAAVRRVARAARFLWPSSEVKVFGSFATGLYLPTSDIDLVILNSGAGTEQSRLRELEARLKAANIARTTEVVAKAKVPIMKFVERWSGIAFDAGLEARGQLESVEMIKEVVREAPWIAPLYRVLKIFLHQNNLNEVYHTGGLNSYTLFVMLRFFLQIYPPSSQLCFPAEHLNLSADEQLGLSVQQLHLANKQLGLSDQQLTVSDKKPGLFKQQQLGLPYQNLGVSDQQLDPSAQNMQNYNLGVLLLGFFHLYGHSLNVREYGISCLHGGCFVRKIELGFVDDWKPYLLAAQDPLLPTNDVGKSSFNFPRIQEAFRRAYAKLNSKLDDGSPLLGLIVSI